MKLAIKLCLWILAFIPLIVDFKVFFPYTSGKNLLIESVLVLAGVSLIIQFFYSRDFRVEIVEKLTKYLKHPLVLSVLAFVSAFAISTAFAVDKYAAFWGDLSRAEGLAGLAFFFCFFVFSLLVFEKKDWIWFFKFSLFVSLILIGKEVAEFFSGIARPGSFTGNPTFLAGYLLFAISSALIVLSSLVPFEIARARSVSSSQMGWRYLSLLVIISATIGIFITQTRGAILGLGLGIGITLIYCAFKGKDINYKVFNLRKISIILLSLGIIFSGVFALTRGSEIWQKVPGLARLAVVNINDEDDPSTQIRLFVYKSALQSVNSAQGNLDKLLIGWGPENFIIADSKYYYPEQYKYEQRWYDRAHNKFLDVLVMNGLFGLLAYLSIWFFLFKSILKEKEFSLMNIGLLIFSASYLAHLLFVFDQISTSIPFFGILAFVVCLTARDQPEAQKKPKVASKPDETREILSGTFLFILVVFLGFILFKNTLPGYIQMRDYVSFIKDSSVSDIERRLDSVLTPLTVAQMNIRRDLLDITNGYYNQNKDEISDRLLKKAIVKAEEYVSKRPQDFGFMTTLADFYNRKGNSSKNTEYLKRGEELLRKVLVFAPSRPDINLKLAGNLFYQDRLMESFELAEKVFALSPVVGQDRVNFEALYSRFVKYFYEQKDKANFIEVADRLKANNYADSASLDQIINYLNTTNTWPKVSFE